MDAPCGSVSTLCAEHGLSRKTFYLLLARAQAEGQAALLCWNPGRDTRIPDTYRPVMNRVGFGSVSYARAGALARVS